jgi:hypothetical protein
MHERLLEYVPLACVELAHEWEAGARLDGGRRVVSFKDFLAARLATSVREIDRREMPHLYDPHKRFQPDRETVCDPTDLELFSAPVQTAADDVETATELLESLSRQMTARGIAAAFQGPTLRLVAGVYDGTIRNGRQAAKALGHENYLKSPATYALLAAHEYLAAVDDPHKTAAGELPSCAATLDPREIV